METLPNAELEWMRWLLMPDAWKRALDTPPPSDGKDGDLLAKEVGNDVG